MIRLLVLAAVSAGVFFTVWPLDMNRSELSVAPQLVLYGGMSFIAGLIAICVIPGAAAELHGAALRIGLRASLFNLVGAGLLTYILAHATKLEAPRYLLVMIVTQTTLNGIWAAYQTTGFDWRILVGIPLALATVFVLGGR